jgi:aminoglycoside phosphotransferase (APT) family kinase protein
MTTRLPNPERAWARAAPPGAIDRAEVERRIGPTRDPLRVLPGGLANLNVRVGSSRVLRIHRRDPASAAREAALLSRAWQSFTVPAVLAAGDDFVLLRHVDHRPAGAGREDGVRVGAALAEIHRTRYAAAGFLDAQLKVARPFSDVFAALDAFARSELDRAGLRDDRLGARLGAFLDADRAPLRAVAGPPVLLHGDFKASNLHETQDGRLLVLDWEFAYSGPALMDVGQLLRWSPPAAFVSGFASGYTRHGGTLPRGWRRWAEVVDLYNLVSLLAGSSPRSPRSRAVRRRMDDILRRMPTRLGGGPLRAAGGRDRGSASTRDRRPAASPPARRSRIGRRGSGSVR